MILILILISVMATVGYFIVSVRVYKCGYKKTAISIFSLFLLICSSFWVAKL